MAQTEPYPKVITASLPTLHVQYEHKFKNYELPDITHIVVQWVPLWILHAEAYNEY